MGLSTLWTSPEPDLPTTPKVKTVNDNTTVSSMSTRRLLLPTVLEVSTEVSSSPASVSSSTEVFTSVFTTPSNHSSSETPDLPSSPSSSVGLLPLFLVLLPTQLTPFDDE